MKRDERREKETHKGWSTVLITALLDNWGKYRFSAATSNVPEKTPNVPQKTPNIP
jgi:hypothetical protein